MPSLERMSTRKDNALSADYTVLVLKHQSTSVPVHPGDARLSELYRKVFLPPTRKPLGKKAGYQVE
jgi:hypothetical protein